MLKHAPGPHEQHESIQMCRAMTLDQVLTGRMSSHLFIPDKSNLVYQVINWQFPLRRTPPASVFGTTAFAAHRSWKSSVGYYTCHDQLPVYDWWVWSRMREGVSFTPGAVEWGNSNAVAHSIPLCQKVLLGLIKPLMKQDANIPVSTINRVGDLGQTLVRNL